MLPALSREVLLEAYSRVLLMRRFDECVVRLRDQGVFNGHYHVYFGQEVTGAAACLTASPDDYIFTTHRNHGHLLARGVDPAPMLAEILGRETGTNGGIAGTFHLSVPEKNILHTSAVVGGIMPIAVGMAFGLRRRKQPGVVMAIFGEGSLQEGAFHEAIQMAALTRPPVVFLIENNDAEAEVGKKVGPYKYLKAAPVKDLGDYPRIHSVPNVRVEGTDFKAVHEAVAAAMDAARRGDGPTFIESRMFRWPGQFGSWPRLVQGPFEPRYAWDESSVDPLYRTWWIERDPVVRMTRELLEAGLLSRAEAEGMAAEATRRVVDAEAFARQSPFPPPSAAAEHVFVGSGANV
ncbi:MAG: thiamine pyrophosphate-dependent dehydrogenase E1 component subunit alpha [Chloroflexota bacterium]